MYLDSQKADIDQMSYTPTRIQDLQTLDLPTVGSTGIKIYDVMRIFTGDNPARQFDCEQQRGGNYSCLCGIHLKDHSNLAAALHQKNLIATGKTRHFQRRDNVETFLSFKH